MKILFPFLLTLALSVSGQDSDQPGQQRLAQLKRSIGENQARLRAYEWVETTEFSLKGEVRKREQLSCRYDASGKLEKTPIGEAPEPGKEARGLKRRVVEKKTAELGDYMDRLGSLVRRYVPPSASALQAAFEGGRGSIDREKGSLSFSDYAKPGDQVVFELDPASGKLRVFRVATYLDGPEDTAKLEVRFSSLADGTSFAEEVALDSTRKQVHIRITNFGHRKAGG